MTIIKGLKKNKSRIPFLEYFFSFRLRWKVERKHFSLYRLIKNNRQGSFLGNLFRKEVRRTNLSGLKLQKLHLRSHACVQDAQGTEQDPREIDEVLIIRPGLI